MTNIIVKSINLITKTAINKADEVISLGPLTAYLVPLKDGTTEHERYVTDENIIVSRQAHIDLGRIVGIEDKNILQDQDILNLNTSLNAIGNRVVKLEGIHTEWNPATRKLGLYNSDNVLLSEISLLSLDNEGTDFRYNSDTLALELWNDQNELIDSIPIAEFVGSVGSELLLNSNKLDLKDSRGNILSSVYFTVDNIEGLESILTPLQEDLAQEIIDRQNADDLKVDKTTTSITAPDSTFKYAYIFDAANNTRRMLAGDLGKNIANSSLTSVAGAGMQLGAPYVWNTAGQPFSITNLPDKSADNTFNNFITLDSAGKLGKGNGKTVVKTMPTWMTEAEKTAWKTEMNGGWTTNTMSVAFISPPIAINNGISYLTLIGANLNLNPINFSIKLISQIDSSVYSIPNNQVILTSASELTIWYDFTPIPIGSYKILLNNGVSEYLTPTTVDIVLNLDPIDISTNTWGVTTYNGNINNTIQQSNTSFSCQLSSDVIPLGLDGKVVLTAMSKSLCNMSDDFYIKLGLWNTGNTNGVISLFGGLVNDVVQSNLMNIIAGGKCRDVNSFFSLSSGDLESTQSAENSIILYKKGTFLTTIVKGLYRVSVITSSVSNDEMSPVKIKLIQMNHVNNNNVSNLVIHSAYKL